MAHLHTKSQVLPSDLDAAARGLTESFESNWTNDLACANSRVVVFYVDWTPGDEDWIELLAVFSGDKEEGQYYRFLTDDDDGAQPEAAEPRLLRVRQDALAESVDDPAESKFSATVQPETHFFAAKFKTSGRFVKLAVRVGMDSDVQIPLSPGTVKLHFATQV